MTSLDQFKSAMVALVVVALILGAMALALDGFQDSIEEDAGLACTEAAASYNTTSGRCENSTGSALGSTTVAFNTTQEGLEGTSNATSYLSTIGTLIGVGALIAIVVAAFYFARR